MKKLFGTDGVRGVANVYPMTTEMAMQIGRAAAYLFKDGNRRHRIVIGKDTRLSGYMLENALVAGICSMGVDVLVVGPLPTPGIANITSSMRADAGVVISASHNPFQDNGIKFFSRDGFKLPDEMELKIEDLIFSGKIDSLRPVATEVGKAYRIDDAVGRYVVFLKNSFPKDLDLAGMKIVLDCANGAAYKVAPAVLEELGAEVIPYGVKPNGTNINAGCGSLYPQVISEAVKEHRADLGIALDGDADRVIFVDEFGNEVDGDHIMAICATQMLKQKKLRKNTLVATVMSNMGLDIAVKRAGGKVVKTAVGDRYVVEEMIKGGYNLGGEQSGHMIFLDHNTTGDGVLSALQVLATMRRADKSLSELAEVMIPLPQVLVNVRVKEKKDITTIPEVALLIGDIEKKLGDEGRILIRYSGTEPLLRIMLEGQDKYQITGWAKEIADLVEKKIGGK
ncbi:MULTISPECIES: phosphoglucosamine mutase [Geobacter]|uniref:Phosphoglucosamine mutase n=1 Tax=Geobacter anodireducens TaxID=1340425 RepID=A0ABR9NWQ0_9BACT|nr:MULTISPECIES: phosphoglucosamine mutase [Geobacter]ADI84640.1 phosphoglucosamine mutase [Geobacter sulfurreducens KN400]AJY71139.1 phosphoglucosamine mutase [Geobacter sulfurreducens]MBE2888668.1 phosphoglucosamine mutase [Geobacter anodireducens]UTG91270.1 phosphoglucosamine mutase [Geobacter sulfurreducens]